MPVSRRVFLQRGGAATAGVALSAHRRLAGFQHHMTRPAARPVGSLRADTLAKFVDPLPIPPKAQPSGFRNDPAPRTVCYRAVMRAVQSRVHRDLPATTFWSFGSSFPGPTFEARRGHGLWIDWINRLPQTHFLPIDHTIHGAEADKPQGRAVVHVHGARVPPESDGYPERWFEHGRVGELLLSQRPGRGHALVPRSHDGHQPPQRVRRADGRVPDPRCRGRRAQPAARSLRRSAPHLRSPAPLRRTARLPGLRQSRLAVGGRCDGRRDPDQRQAVSLPRRGAAQVSVSH